MVHGNAGRLQPCKSFRTQKTMGCTQTYLFTFPAQKLVGFYQKIQLLSLYRSASCHNRVGMHAGCLPLLTVLKNHLRFQHSVHIAAGMIMGRLRTEFTVLTAAPGTAIDYRT